MSKEFSLKVTDFDLGLTLECGQAFRWDKIKDKEYSGVIGRAIVKMRQDGGRLIGCMGMDSQQIPGDILVGGVWKYILIGQWGGINVLLNPYSRDDRDEWKLTLNGYMDVAVRRAQAFNRSGDSANQ